MTPPCFSQKAVHPKENINMVFVDVLLHLRPTVMWGSMYDGTCLHVAWSYTSSHDRSFFLISSLPLSNHLLLGLILLPRASVSIVLLPSQCLSLLHITCPYHFNHLSWTFLDIPRFHCSPDSCCTSMRNKGLCKEFFSPKIRDYYGSGWVGPGPTGNFLCVENRPKIALNQW